MDRNFIRNQIIVLWYRGFVDKDKIAKNLFEIIEAYFNITDNYFKYYLFQSRVN